MSDWKDVIRTAARRARVWADGLTGPPPPPAPPAAPVEYRRLAKVLVTDEVTRTLFDEYAAHRASDRGGEEIGWVLLGVRQPDAVTVLATLPAGADRDAGAEHVRFNPDAQAVGSRIVRQADRRLSAVGVVHTHPGTLRHPSGGDLRGDRDWVTTVRGHDGVFGIGTAGGGPPGPTLEHPAPNVQCFQGLRFDWYGLAAGDPGYRPLPVELTIGPDLAKPLRAVWPAVEAHAGRLEGLARQLSRVRFELLPDEVLAAVVPLAAPGHAVRVLLTGPKQVRFVYDAAGELFAADLPAGTRPDHGVYQLLAELAARD